MDGHHQNDHACGVRRRVEAHVNRVAEDVLEDRRHAVVGCGAARTREPQRGVCASSHGRASRSPRGPLVAPVTARRGAGAACGRRPARGVARVGVSARLCCQSARVGSRQMRCA
eukprot:7055990-Prymnesium_polylepis.1